MKRKLSLILSVIALTSIVVAYGLQQSQALFMYGRQVSQDIRVIDGKAYVPVDDVARALAFDVRSTPQGLELFVPGGAEGMNIAHTGRLGDDIFTGEWRVQITAVEEMTAFSYQFHSGPPRRQFILPAGQKFIVVTGRIANGTNERVEVLFDTRADRYGNTALTTPTGEATSPLDFDVLLSSVAGAWGADALPGAAINFRIVFQVPQDFEYRDLIFSIARTRDVMRVSEAATNVRIRLTDD